MTLCEKHIDEIVIENEYLSSPPCDPKSFSIGYRAALSAIVEGKHPFILMDANIEQHRRLEEQLQKEHDDCHKVNKNDQSFHIY